MPAGSTLHRWTTTGTRASRRSSGGTSRYACTRARWVSCPHETSSGARACEEGRGRLPGTAARFPFRSVGYAGSLLASVDVGDKAEDNDERFSLDPR